MPKQIAYFDSQASAAASLGIDIYKLRAAKRDGCPAFRSGRVYREELLQWFEEKERREAEKAENNLDNENPQFIAARTILGFHQLANLKLITHEQHFECCKAVVEAVNDEEIYGLFLGTMHTWILSNFGKFGENVEHDDEWWAGAFLAASKVYPQIVKWWIKTADAHPNLPGEKCAG
jgi:hypothetical protein